MRRILVAALLLVVLQAGCAEPAAQPAPEGGDDGRDSRIGRGADGEAGHGHYDASFDLMVNPDGAGAVAVGGLTNTNCVLFWDFNGADYALSNGTATLTWDALTPAAEELALYVTGGGGESVSGPSPLVLSIEALDASDWGLGFAADSPLPSVAFQQAVALALAFDWEGDLPSPGQGSCSNGL
jgi:hypothetical protein